MNEVLFTDNIVGIVGYVASGKDTVARIIKEHFGFFIDVMSTSLMSNSRGGENDEK